MSIAVHNNSRKSLKLKDFYVLDSERNVGYYGALEYPIAAGGKKGIRSSVFTDEMMVEKKPQEVHVKSGEETLLVLNHEDFKNNKGSDLFFEMGDSAILRARFDRRTGGIAIAQRIRGMFRLRGAGTNAESPIAEAGILCFRGAGTNIEEAPASDVGMLCFRGAGTSKEAPIVDAFFGKIITPERCRSMLVKKLQAIHQCIQQKPNCL